MIPYGCQDIDEEDIAAVVEVLKSDWLTQGPSIDAFERKMADYIGVRYAVAVCNATAALHLACRVLGLGPGKTMWTSPNTFVASANCARYCGAGVDFVDIDRRTYNMSVDALAKKLHRAKKDGKLPHVVVAVHFAGQPCEMAEIAGLAKDYGFAVIEDAAHAIGSTYKNEKTGNCRYSDITVFSFHPVKILTTGEGGMLLSNRDDLHERLTLLRTHGITRLPRQMTGKSEGGWYYEQIDLGFNYRMTDIQAALGTSQLDRIEQFLTRRREIAGRYDTLLAGLPLTLPWQHPDTLSSYHLYPIQLQLDRAGTTRRAVFDHLRNAGIGVNVHYIPVHWQPYYRDMGFRVGDFPEAERYYAAAISLPIHYRLTHADQERVVAALRAAL